MNEPLTTITSPAVALLVPDVDTDVITPMRRLMERGDKPLHHYAFEALRYLDGDGDTGRPDPDFCLNRPDGADAELIFVGENFGCGSSRESAPEVLAALGFRCLVGPSFGDIFFNNCFQNGILPIVADSQIVNRLAGLTGKFTVDLEAQLISAPDGTSVAFDCNPFRKASLLGGLDDIAMTLQAQASIDRFIEADKIDRPWLWLAEGDSAGASAWGEAGAR